MSLTEEEEDESVRPQQRIFDVDVLSNKVDVGSLPGTMWSLSSQKPGHGIAQLRHSNTSNLWQSDGMLPHAINIQFRRRTAVTHVSIYLDHLHDDSYTPVKIKIMAGTHFHDLVEVRARDFALPQGWKHFILDKKDAKNESDESDVYTSSSSEEEDLSDNSPSISSLSDGEVSDQSDWMARQKQRSEKVGKISSHEPCSREAGHVAHGVSRRHAPIYTYLVQVCILANHSAGKDSHVRGLKVWGPPTKLSREKVKKREKGYQSKKLRSAEEEKEEEARADGKKWQKVERAKQELYKWALMSEDATTSARAREERATPSVRRGGHKTHIPSLR